jgi:tetratricopeptide (TPR) repeat protein
LNASLYILLLYAGKSLKIGKDRTVGVIVMKIAENRPDQLQMLAVRLQVALQDKALRRIPQIRCGVRQEKLLVLAQYPMLMPDAGSLFAALEQAIRQMPWSAIAITPDQQALPVQLLLQVIGQKPYASRTFWLEPAQVLESTSQIVPFKPSVVESAAVISETVIPERIIPEVESEIHNPVTILALPTSQQSSQVNLTLLIVGAIAGLTALVGGFYMLTRPCVLGECVPLRSAEQLSQMALQTVQSTTSAQAVVNAYDQLLEANYLVGTIPHWSKQYAIAQTRLQTYTTQAEGLEQIVSALRLGQTAVQRGQNPPHPLQTWQEIQALWQQAIAQLKQVPANSPVNALAQRKLVEYQANLTTLNQRIAIERQAQAKVVIARNTARIAEARGGIATSLAAWQLTHATWQTAINLLQQIPKSTMAQAEAQQLLAIYEPRLSAARDRQTQEEISAKFYNQALALANRARLLEQQNQWSQSANQWQDALVNAQQVLHNTSYYLQSQSLVNAYTAAHTRSQEILRAAILMQSTSADLSRTCAGTPKICDYSFTDKAIRVNITADYDRAIEQTIARTQLTSNSDRQTATTDQVNFLLRDLAAIGKNANTPIELYNSDGSLFGSYVPEFSGYVTR